MNSPRSVRAARPNRAVTVPTAGCVRISCNSRSISGTYNPFGATQNPQDVIDQITTSLVRRGKAELTMYDASISGELFDFGDDAVRMAAGVEYREESVADVPDDQFQRGLIFGTESVSAAGARDIWSAYVEFAVPLFKGLDLSRGPALRRLQRFRQHDQSEAVVALCADRLARVPRLLGHGLPRAVARADWPWTRPRSRASSATRSAAPTTRLYCAATDYTIVFTGNPEPEGGRIRVLQLRRVLGGCGLHGERRLLGHHAG